MTERLHRAVFVEGELPELPGQLRVHVDEHALLPFPGLPPPVSLRGPALLRDRDRFGGLLVPSSWS